jgi:hypothetical protein
MDGHMYSTFYTLIHAVVYTPHAVMQHHTDDARALVVGTKAVRMHFVQLYTVRTHAIHKNEISHDSVLLNERKYV